MKKGKQYALIQIRNCTQEVLRLNATSKAVFLFFWMSTILRIGAVMEILREWGLFIGTSKYNTIGHLYNFYYFHLVSIPFLCSRALFKDNVPI